MVQHIYTICLILILILPGCIYDKETIIPDWEDKDISNIELKLSLGTSTRVGEEYMGNKDENFLGLNEKDFKIAVFNGEGVYLGNFEPTETNYPVEGVDYDAILKGNLNKILVGENTTLQLMMLVNWKTFDNSYPDNFDGRNLTQIYDDNESYNYTMYGENPTESWRPSALEKKGIPMFGISEKENIPANIDNKENVETISFRINLIRCMAKITVENHFNDNVGDAGYNIKSISLSKYNKKGTLIPNNWKFDSKEVSAPWLPKSESRQEGFDLPLYIETKNPEIWVIYIPEAAYTESDGIPILNFTIETTTEAETTAEMFNKELPLFGDFNEESEGTLLRNNIYNYKITIEEKNISFVYTVCPWYEGYNATFEYK